MEIIDDNYDLQATDILEKIALLDTEVKSLQARVDEVEVLSCCGHLCFGNLIG